ncbi:hypothetical protein FOIG_15520 [Fusarium odoratissimum NRRL 54006]|uniref:Uncharacterized protein n=1 Tax=Fusarium odoratissimum (strain NRRL 54006) TaxID=1089451 RepID=X0IQN0_FUSO5|nr:uncharacterized protein FOIG_15520 [Fusarium odoratissimum NRRL 54006]EXL91233.1 hypothetical protein FOIG_15520 [Fusarium odoratissimum NRRL 54006]
MPQRLDLYGAMLASLRAFLLIWLNAQSAMLQQAHWMEKMDETVHMGKTTNLTSRRP